MGGQTSGSRITLDLLCCFPRSVFFAQYLSNVGAHIPTGRCGRWRQKASGYRWAEVRFCINSAGAALSSASRSTSAVKIGCRRDRRQDDSQRQPSTCPSRCPCYLPHTDHTEAVTHRRYSLIPSEMWIAPNAYQHIVADLATHEEAQLTCAASSDQF